MSYVFTGIKTITIPEGSVKKVTDATGKVLWQKQVLITFEYRLGGASSTNITTYTAVEGMTWAEYVASSYNTHGFKIISNNRIADNRGIAIVYSISPVYATDKIKANATYFTTS